MRGRPRRRERWRHHRRNPLRCPDDSFVQTFSVPRVFKEIARACGRSRCPAFVLLALGDSVRYNVGGVFIGSQKVTATLDLGGGGDDFTTRSGIEVFDTNDNLIVTACATAVGRRFE